MFDQTAEPVRELLLKTTSSLTQEESILEDMKNEEGPTEDIMLSVNDDISDILNPTVSNRESLSVLNNRANFEKHLVGLKDNQNKKQEQKKNNILVITATIVKDDAKTMIGSSNVTAAIIKELDASSILAESAHKQDRNRNISIVDQLL